MQQSRKSVLFFFIVGFFCLVFLSLPVAAYGYGPFFSRSDSQLGAIKNSVLPGLKADIRDKGFRWGSPVFLRIFKEEKILELWIKKSGKTDEYGYYKSYNICKHSGGLGPKIREGDKQAPEGFYAVPKEMLHPRSKFHLALNIGFPNDYDAAHNRSGSFLMIHGKCSSEGCFAMSDENIEEIYLLSEAALKKGQNAVPVHIFPFRLEESRLQARKSHKWYPFWENLRDGYAYFEQHRTPPQVTVENGRYAVSNR